MITLKLHELFREDPKNLIVSGAGRNLYSLRDAQGVIICEGLDEGYVRGFAKGFYQAQPQELFLKKIVIRVECYVEEYLNATTLKEV
jgi:hypothetical protein